MNTSENKKAVIRSFRDLNVYQGAYEAMLIMHKEVLPKLPLSEKFDLRDQLSRSTKAVPRLIAEGYAKKHQKAGFQKYLDDAHTESNESIVGIEQCRDLYNLDSNLSHDLIDRYEKISDSCLIWRKHGILSKISDDKRHRRTIRVALPNNAFSDRKR